jgi:hypothetical protein
MVVMADIPEFPLMMVAAFALATPILFYLVWRRTAGKASGLQDGITDQADAPGSAAAGPSRKGSFVETPAVP